MQRYSRQTLFECIVQFTGQPISFSQHSFKIRLRFVPGTDLLLELPRSLLDPDFQFVVGLLQRLLSSRACDDLFMEQLILPRQHQSPEQRHEKCGDDQPKEQPHPWQSPPGWPHKYHDIFDAAEQQAKRLRLSAGNKTSPLPQMDHADTRQLHFAANS